MQQSPLNAIQDVTDFKPAVAVHQGVEYRTRPATAAELEDLLFGWQVEQGVTSNSVLYVKRWLHCGHRHRGTGPGGSRRDCHLQGLHQIRRRLCFKKLGMAYKDLELQIEQGKGDKKLKDEIDAQTRTDKGGLIGAAMISDAFFPFRDGVDVALRQGIQAIAHAGGSMRDYESIQACNEAQPPATMVFTGQRAFKH